MRLDVPIRSNKLIYSVETTSHLASVRSPFQQIDVYDSDVFGRMLLLDGHIQLTTLDEHAYHECLVWIPLLQIENPERALVIGGGDGGVARELCRHQGIAHIDMVEIDHTVVDVSKQWLPSVNAGAFDDPRLHLSIADAFEFVKQDLEPYDLIVVDSTDVYEDEEGELSERIFTDEFFGRLALLATDRGFVVTQADNPVFCPYSLKETRDMFARAFVFAGSYWGIVPSFGGFSAFCWGGRNTMNSGWTRPNASLAYLNEATYALAFSELSTT